MSEDTVKVRLTMPRSQYNALMAEANGQPLAPMLVRWLAERLDSGVSAPSDTQVLTFGEPEVPDTDTWILANLDAWKEHGPKNLRRDDGTFPYSDDEWLEVKRDWVAANHHRF